VDLVKPSSLPKGYLSTLADSKIAEHHEDTDSYFSSFLEESDLENEIKSRNEAEDELASLFEISEDCASNSPDARMSFFERPRNPIVCDSKFVLARCSAPSVVEQPMFSPLALTKSERRASVE
jgi:hypothetical protein